MDSNETIEKLFDSVIATIQILIRNFEDEDRKATVFSMLLRSDIRATLENEWRGIIDVHDCIRFTPDITKESRSHFKMSFSL